MDFDIIPIKLTEGQEAVIGQANFSFKTVDDLAMQVISTVPNVRVGVSVNDGGAGITRTAGNDDRLIRQAGELCNRIGAGHVFVILMEGAFPSHVMNNVGHVNGVCNIFAATSNPMEVLVAKTQLGRAVIGVVDGLGSRTIEDDETKKGRREMLKKIGFEVK